MSPQQTARKSLDGAEGQIEAGYNSIFSCEFQIFFLLLHSIFKGVEMKSVLYLIPRQLTKC